MKTSLAFARDAKRRRVTLSLCSIMFGFVAAVLFLFLYSNAVMGQTGTATLSGLVTDAAGAVVPNCEVQLQSVERGTVTVVKTNNDGIYVATAIQPGQYNITIKRSGFKQVDIVGVILNTQDHVQQNFRLQVGSVSESVTVNANEEHMPTDEAAVGLLVNREFVEKTPLNGRSFQDLIALAPGAVSSPSQQTGLYSINGQREDSNYFTVDGIGANLGLFTTGGLAGTVPAQTALGTTQSLVSVDALQEFKVQTSGYSAEHGRQPGGQVELTTRSGSNDVHGSLFDYFRNDALDANDWFLNQQKIPKQAERQNDFGGTFGGPVVLPKLYSGKDKTFFFFSYEGLRLRQPQFSGIHDVPTQAFRQFAAPGVQPFLKAIPLPNGKDNGDQCALSEGQNFSCTGQWSTGFSVPSSLDSVSIRLDQIVGEKAQFFVRYSDVPSQQASEFVSTVNNLTADTETLTLGGTLRVAPTLTWESRFGYSTANLTNSQYPIVVDGSIPYPRSLVFPSEYAATGAPAYHFGYVSLPGSAFIPTPNYYSGGTSQKQFNFINSFSWTRHSHTFEFGEDYRRLEPLYNPYQYYSEFDITSLAAIQQGFADQAFIDAYQKAYPTFNNLSLYAEDGWRISSRLTFDYGLRWELDPAPGASDGVYPLALTSSNLASAQIASRGTAQYRTRYDNLAPRLGFAYQLNNSGKHAVVVRAGFGIFYDTGQAQGAAGYGGYPFQAFSSASSFPLPASPGSLAPPSLNFPLTPPYGPINGISDPHLKLPSTQHWNFSLDLGLSARNTMTASYVGNVGRHLLFQNYYNDLSSENPEFTSLSLISASAASSYNAFQLQDRGYLLPGMQVITSYTWSHAIDDVSSDNNGSPARGNSDYDVRQILNTALNYQIPGVKSGTAWKRFTNGWSLQARFGAQSGLPIDVIQGSYTAPSGISQTFRPDLVPGRPIVFHNVPNVLGNWGLNPAAFLAVPTGPDGTPIRQGDLGRNFIHGPNFWSLNFALQNDIPFSERLGLTFRVEAFNILNHPNPGAIDNFLTDSTFGTANYTVARTGAPTPLYGNGSARSLQIALKLHF